MTTIAICHWCGKPVEKKPCEIEAGKLLFCDKTCHDNHQRGGDMPSKEELSRLLLTDRLTVSAVADRYGVSGRTVRNWAKRHDLSYRPQRPTGTDLEDMLHTQGLSYTQVADRYDVDQSAVYYWRKQHGIETPETWLDQHSSPDELKKLQDLYNDGLTMAELAALYNVSEPLIKKLFKRNAIPVRKDGWGGKRYTAKDGTEVRSSYERKVADWLTDRCIAYTYEPPLPFATMGKADFLVNGWYIEVWGVTNSPAYKVRKAKKCAHYQAYNVPLIELPIHSFDKQHDRLWERKLTQCLIPPSN